MGEIRLYDGVIYSGGGAKLMKSEYVDALTTNDPQFNNVHGALMMIDGE